MIEALTRPEPTEAVGEINEVDRILEDSAQGFKNLFPFENHTREQVQEGLGHLLNISQAYRAGSQEVPFAEVKPNRRLRYAALVLEKNKPIPKRTLLKIAAAIADVTVGDRNSIATLIPFQDRWGIGKLRSNIINAFPTCPDNLPRPSKESGMPENFFDEQMDYFDLSVYNR